MTQAAPNQHQQTNSQQNQQQEPLTKREVEVAALVGLALTDRQIAGVLFISTRTVKAHINSIREKYNLSNRTAVCRWVLVSKYEQKIDLFDNVL